MKKRYLVGAATGAVLLLGTAETANALGIPVIDVAALTQLIAQVTEAEKAFALQVSSYALQIKQYAGEYFGWVTEYGQYVTELAHYYNDALMLLNFSHHPTLGAAAGLMNIAGLGNSLPFNPYSAMNLINGSSYGQGGFAEIGGLLNGLSGMANASYAQNRLYTPTDGSWASQQLTANSNSIAGGQGAAMAAYGDYRNHMGVLPTLRQNAATATTTKDALDTSNQLQAEIAWNVNELGQAQQIATASTLQQQARIQRDEERLACELEMFRNGGGACPSGANGPVAGGGGGANGGSDTMPVPPVPPLPANSGAPLVVQPDPPMPVPPQPVAPPPAYEEPAPPPVPTAPNAPPPAHP